jgi:hypothetical protein
MDSDREAVSAKAAPDAAEAPEVRADQSVATRFTRMMNASTSRWGVLTDPPIVAVACAVLVLALLGAKGAGAGEAVVRALVALAILPIAVAVALTLALMGARRRVVAWLARQPFPVDNMNAVLNGLGEALEVSFVGEVPKAEEINPELDKVHPDSFVTGMIEETRTMEIRIGVVDSKRNPAATNHQRYARVIALVEQVLAPAHARYPIACVRVK